MTHSENSQNTITSVEDIGKHLASILGGDNCHNLDRISRLAGTINRPDGKKIKKGRIKAPSYIVSYKPENTYTLDDFPRPKVYLPETRRSLPVSLTDKQTIVINNINDLDKLDLPEPLKIIIINGRGDTKVEGKDDSNSGWLMTGIMSMLKIGVADDVIYTIITNKNFKISEHILTKGLRYNKYAERQIERAKSFMKKHEEKGWDQTDEATGQPKRSYHNTRVAIIRLHIECIYDQFIQRYRVGGNAIQQYQGELSDKVAICLRDLIKNEFGFDPGRQHVIDALESLCVENIINPVKDYLDSLTWDQCDRLETFLIKYFGAQDSQLIRAIGKLLLTAAVRRVRNPGCKFDLVIILEGKQGSGKSSALMILAGKEYYSDQDLFSLNTKEQMEALEGVWIFELGELSGIRRADIDRLKAFISRTEDRARPAFGRYKESRPRTCIFIGTTNEGQYLRDITGNRRFIPIETGKIDLVALQNDRDQLWAEAAYLEAQGMPISLPEELWLDAAEAQNDRMEYDPWIDILSEVEGNSVSSASVFEMLEIPKERSNNGAFKRIGHIMRQLGWDGPKTVRIGAKACKGFTRNAEPQHEVF